MKKLFLGFDTSNYTTSVSFVDAEKNVLANIKCPLRVKEGNRGLRQSDAVFSHIVNFPEIASRIRETVKNCDGEITAVGYSKSPRGNEGSYMPCFLVGEAVAETVGAVLDTEIFTTSHQGGHVAAALFSACKNSGISAESYLCEPFLAFHVSGGTTDLLLVKPNRDKIFDIERIGGSEDANAGQMIDRTGVRLGIPFPCGGELDRLALLYDGNIKCGKLSVKGLDCNLSGLENKANDMIRDKETPEKIGAFVLEFIGRTMEKLVVNAFDTYGELPVIFAGGVMSSGYIKRILSPYGMFASPDCSADNAVGVATLTALMYENNHR